MMEVSVVFGNFMWFPSIIIVVYVSHAAISVNELYNRENSKKDVIAKTFRL